MTHMPMPLRRRVASLFQIAAAIAAGTAIGVRLSAYGVPLLLLTACAVSVASSALWLFERIAEALASTTHRCTAPGCDFRVRVQQVDAGENRRWQEIAAAHPYHDAV